MRKLLGAVAAALLAVSAWPSAGTSAAAQTPGSITVTGHGWGHGRGLGQYGSYGYAKDMGWSWQSITDHFYGGTSLGTAGDDELDVLLKAYGTGWTVAFLESGSIITSLDNQITGPPTPNRRSVAIQWVGGNRFRLYEGDSCNGYGGGPMIDRGEFTAPNGEVVIVTNDPAPNDRVELLGACEFDGNGALRGHRYLRGAIVADSFTTAVDATERQRTMNRVRVESYLRSVVPAESPSSWGGNGSAPGMHALRSQAVAARSYALAGDTRWGNAESCDDVFCQVYRGYGYNALGAVTFHETANGDLAVSQTTGQVRRRGNGTIARTEFSSSTGGYTAGGDFPAVPDEGDDVAGNSNHNWSATIPIAEVETRMDARAGRDLGAFSHFEITARNGLGAEGGRVRNVVGHFSGGTITLTGDGFRSSFQTFGVKSDWFSVPGGAPPPTTTTTTTTTTPPTTPPTAPLPTTTTTRPAPPPPGGSFNDTNGHAHAATIERVAAAGIASGYPDGGFHPDVAVTRGQMATFMTRGYRLPPASSPTFTDIGGDTHEANIRAAAAAGIARGQANGSFGPAVPVTRGQMAVFLFRAEGLTAVDGSGGCDIDGHLYEGEIRAVMAAGIASGSNDGCFHPQEAVTRGQMATFLVRALGL